MKSYDIVFSVPMTIKLHITARSAEAANNAAHERAETLCTALAKRNLSVAFGTIKDVAPASDVVGVRKDTETLHLPPKSNGKRAEQQQEG